MQEPTAPPRNETEIGDWLRAAIEDEVVIETDGWAAEVVTRAAKRLQQGDAPELRLEPIVPWISEPTAFTAPGRYVYVSRELLQQLATEDSVAMVLAHEMAHHRLRHFGPFLRSLRVLERMPGAFSIAGLVQLATRFAFSAERELAADRWAFERCRAVGYDGERCLDIFRVLERCALDRRDLSAVFGPEDEQRLAEEVVRVLDGEVGLLMHKARRSISDAQKWLWKRRRGYPTLRERRAALRRT